VCVHTRAATYHLAKNAEVLKEKTAYIHTDSEKFLTKPHSINSLIKKFYMHDRFQEV
jgi:hypothetical protein